MHLLATVKNVIIVPIHPKGKPFIAIAAAVAVLLFLLDDYAGLVGLLGLAFCTYFFRDPKRVVPQGEGFILATGDGVISHISQAPLPKELGADDTLYHKVSIFLNVFNVHVNRVPASGTVTKHVYIPGKFINAELDKASEDNERTVSTLQNNQGETIGFSQIAGFVARRIVHEIQPGQSVSQGDRYGIIRFGSRCDVYIPLHYQLLVGRGSVTIGGETILALNPSQFQPLTLTWSTK